MGGNKMVTVCHWLMCGVDVYLLYLFFHSIFERKLGKSYFIGACFLTTYTIFYVNSFKSSFANLMGIPLIYLAFVLLTFKISRSNAVAYTVIFYIAFAAGKEAAFVLLNQFLYSMFPEAYTAVEGPDGLYILIVEYFLGYLMLRFTCKHTKMLKMTEDKRFSWFLLITPISTLIVLSSFLYMDYPVKKIIQFSICAGSFLLYFSNIAIFVTLFKYTHILGQVKNAQMYMLKAELEMNHFEKAKDLNAKNRNFIHDSHKFNSNIRMLASRNENSKIIELIDQLEGKMHRIAVEKVYSTNSVLDSILSEKVIRCEAQDIKIDMFIETSLNVDFIQVSDLISMFGNLLDNAIEAAAKCNEGQREIRVKLFMANPYILVLHIENSFVSQLQMQGNYYVTTKQDKLAHGLGIGIAESLVKKYKGTLELTAEQGCFRTMLTLSKT